MWKLCVQVLGSASIFMIFLIAVSKPCRLHLFSATTPFINLEVAWAQTFHLNYVSMSILFDKPLRHFFDLIPNCHCNQTNSSAQIAPIFTILTPLFPSLCLLQQEVVSAPFTHQSVRRAHALRSAAHSTLFTQPPTALSPQVSPLACFYCLYCRA